MRPCGCSKNYNKAKDKKVTVTIKPKKCSVKSVKSSKRKQITVKWARDSKASGYQISYADNKKFKKAQSVYVKSKKTIAKTVTKKLSPGKKYYVKVRAYKTVGKTKLYGSYSSVKSVRVKK